MKRRQASWDPLANVGKAVDTLLSDPPQQGRTLAVKKGGRPRVEGRGRIVLYLEAKQIYNLKRAALDRGVDVSTLAREVFAKAKY